MELKYRVINTTIKPPKYDTHGNDVRKNLEKNGHPVKFKEKDRDVVLHPGQVRLVSELNTGMLSLRNGKYINIEEITNMTSALKDHVFKPEEVATQPAPTAPVEKKEEVKADLPYKVRAVEMGKDNYDQKGGTEHEGAINPDGNPNFIVQAKRKNKNATVTSDSSKDGEGAQVPPTLS
jgi:hypothetical protein